MAWPARASRGAILVAMPTNYIAVECPNCKFEMKLFLMGPTSEEESDVSWHCINCMHLNKVRSKKSFGGVEPMWPTQG